MNMQISSLGGQMDSPDNEKRKVANMCLDFQTGT